MLSCFIATAIFVAKSGLMHMNHYYESDILDVEYVVYNKLGNKFDYVHAFSMELSIFAYASRIKL